MDKKIISKLLDKIKLYCILHNAQDRDEVPYHCSNCKYLSYNCTKRNPIYFTFSSNNTYKNFRDGISLESFYTFSGCDKWEKK